LPRVDTTSSSYEDAPKEIACARKLRTGVEVKMSDQDWPFAEGSFGQLM
jgi:hypothetical protein